MRPVNDEEILLDLDRRSRGYGNGARLARAWGVEPAHLSDIKSGYRHPNQKIAAGLGWELRWVRKQEDGAGGAKMKLVRN